MKVTIKTHIDVEQIAYDYVNSELSYYYDNAEDYLYGRMCDFLFDIGFGEIPKKSYRKLCKKFLKLVDKYQKE